MITNPWRSEEGKKKAGEASTDRGRHAGTNQQVNQIAMAMEEGPSLKSSEITKIGLCFKLILILPPTPKSRLDGQDTGGL